MAVRGAGIPAGDTIAQILDSNDIVLSEPATASGTNIKLTFSTPVLTAAGTAYEHFLSGTGAFSYARPDLGNLPAWLPGLYLQGAPLAIDLVASFVKPRVRG